jgi:trans-2-enoyl-CoA reductase
VNVKRVLFVNPEAPPPLAVEVREEEAPVPGPGEVVVRVLARPINPADLLILEGRHLFRPQPPAPVGIEGVGVIEATGERVAIPWGGTWSERIAVPASDLLLLPDEVSTEQGAMLSVNPFTAAGMLEGLPEGSWLVLNAATSAVGRMVLALARRRGLHAIAVSRSLRARDPLLDAGAAAVLEDGPDLTARFAQVAGGPVQRALDAVAGEASGRMLDALAEGGRLVVYGLLSSDRVVLPAASVVFRDVQVVGFSRRRSIGALSPERRAAITRELGALVAEGVLSSAVEARYPLEQVREALAHHLRPDRWGKILLTSPAAG